MNKSQKSWTPWVLLLLVIIGAYGFAVYLQVNGSLNISYELPLASLFKKQDSESANSQENLKGKIAVPISATDISAYTKMRREHLWDPKRGRLTVLMMNEEDIPKTVLRSIPEILGRVLDHDKAAGYFFTEKDFYPKGTREGLVAGIPPNKMMLLVEASKVKGLFGLRPGDRFDIVRTTPVNPKGAGPASKSAGPYGDQLSFAMKLSNWEKQAEVRVVVRDGMIVTPVKTRAKPTGTQSLTRGTVTRTVPIQEIYIAVDPAEAAPLTEAIAVGSDVRAIIRSGHAQATHETGVSDLQPKNPLGDLLGNLVPSNSNSKSTEHDSESAKPQFRLVEKVEGGERQLVTIPSYTGEENLNDSQAKIRIVPAAGPDEDSNNKQDDDS